MPPAAGITADKAQHLNRAKDALPEEVPKALRSPEL